MDMSYSDVGSEVISGLEDAIFGKDSNVTDFTTTVDPFNGFDPFADDDFFYPRVIHDSEKCKWIIQHKISHINVRLWDLLFFIPSSLFLTFLLFGHIRSRQRLDGPATLSSSKSVMYYSVLVMVISCLVRSFANMVVTMEMENSTSEKLGWVVITFVYLTAEISNLILASCISWISRPGIRNSLVIATSISLIICSIQLYLEINVPYYGYKIIHSGIDLYGHGGPVYHCAISGMMSLVYLLAMLSAMMPGNKHRVTGSAAFYCYCTCQFTLNLITCFGALLISLNKHGGLCITDFASFIYFSFVPALVYVCYVRQGTSLRTPNFMFAYSAQVDDTQDEGVFMQSDSVQSFDLAGGDTIIKSQQPDFTSTTLSAGLQSPTQTEDVDLLIQ